jgi:hypothetical protein
MGVDRGKRLGSGGLRGWGVVSGVEVEEVEERCR